MDTQDTFVVFFSVFADQSLCLSASFPRAPLCALHFRHHDQTTSLEPAFTNRDVCNSFRMCSYVNCQVSPAQASPFLKSCLNFSVTLHSSPLTHHFSGPFFSCTSALFHFPYPVSPVFVTLTKTTGVYTKNSHSGIRHPSLTTIIFVASFHILTNCSFPIPFVLTFMRRMGGVGGPAARFLKYSFNSVGNSTGRNNLPSGLAEKQSGALRPLQAATTSSELSQAAHHISFHQPAQSLSGSPIVVSFHPVNILLNEIECRVLGSLVEKEITTPEYYPLSLNALVNVCNQKSNREPAMNLDESAVRQALHSLDEQSLVRSVSAADSRVTKYEHRLQEAFNFYRHEIAILCVLLLRGPQTPGELRTRAERMHSFDDLSAVQSSLQHLMKREPPLVKVLPRQPGTKEARYAHLFSGDVEAGDARPASEATAASLNADGERIAILEEKIAGLQKEIADLRQQFAVFRKQFE